ncbi:Protein FAM227A [Acipenser ruthenus]|uniref:Protein FAM227A n=1 Tax=Acipenser ruthenus TaxID=7906 RepID=A0A444U0Q9_ACIRT|nr:Protein FAM227A [Acipenser ruthenus]
MVPHSVQLHFIFKREAKGLYKNDVTLNFITVTVRDEKELNKFARRYQEHSTHALGLENQSQTSLRTLKRTKEKPKLVELQQYPGFTIGAPTALPNGTSLDDVVKHVIQAQEKIGRKPKYQAEFRRLLSSSVTRTILLDTFWWFFLQNYQSEPHTQEKLFFRISESYVRLLTQSPSSPYGDLFLKSSQHCARISSQVSMNSASSAQGTPSCVPMTAGPGPEFMKSVFNLWGYSPLVQCYFRNQKMDIRAGMDILVQRTEILNLPPYPFFALLPVFSLYPAKQWEIEWETEFPEELALAFEEALQAQD